MIADTTTGFAGLGLVDSLPIVEVPQDEAKAIMALRNTTLRDRRVKVHEER